MGRRILAIESATDWLSVAFLDGEDVIEQQRSNARMQHAAALLPAIDATLAAAASDLDGIDAIALSIGPGSFTSLRIGLATVKGLGFRRDLEAVGVSTLEAMALAGLEGAGRNVAGFDGVEEVLALLDARRGEWYAGSWMSRSARNAIPEISLAEGLYSPDRIAASLRGPVGIIAPQPAGWLAAFEAAGVDVAHLLDGEAAAPSAEWVGRLGQRRLDTGEGVPARDLGARYLRRAEAEAKRLGGPVEAGEVAELSGAGAKS
jgi:tRNA threonylcarbamoyladenosine biosynthesis protein TsaB